MKILIAFKAKPEDVHSIVMPHSLLYIATFLRDKGYDVELRNYSVSDNLKSDIDSMKPDYFATIAYVYNNITAFDMLRQVKAYDNKIKTVLVGPLATFLADEILKKYKVVDYVLGGEPEQLFYTLLTQERFNKRIDVDELPSPSKYYQYQRIITSRGCQAGCIYCGIPAHMGDKIRYRSAKKIFDEIFILNSKYGISHFVFVDDTFANDKDRLISLCKMIIEKELHITFECKSQIHIMDRERLLWMKKAGCASISYDVLSGSISVLKNLNKPTDTDVIVSVAKETRRLGIQFEFDIYVGCPGENEDSINDTIALLHIAKPNLIKIAKMQVNPGSPIGRVVKDKSTWLNSEDPVYYVGEKTQEELEHYMLMIKDGYRGFSFTFEELISIIKNDPYSFLAFNLLGVFYMQRGMNQDALIAFLKSVKINPGFSMAHNNLGVLCVKVNNVDLAKKHFLLAIKTNPMNIAAKTNLARLYDETKEPAKALELYIETLKVDPNNQAAKDGINQNI